MMNTQDTCFWGGSVGTFLESDTRTLMESLQAGHARHCNETPGESQSTAWRNSINVLLQVLKGLPSDLGLIFEYILPRERGRRPDVILLTPQRVLVIEFKDYAVIHSAHIDQVASYARDLMDYQSFCRNKEVIPILVLTKASRLSQSQKGVHIHSPDTLAIKLNELLDHASAGTTQLENFLKGDYAPLPSIVSAAKLLFEHHPLPQIRRAESAGIPETIRYLHALADDAISGGKKLIALVTGVPGSGKTLVGLQFVYDRSNHEKNQAVFLSGNGPLVEVLQYALKTRVFVQDVHGFLKQYAGHAKKAPQESIWIYDEAQRAWDDHRAKEKRGENALSEPKDFVNLGAGTPGGVVIIGLIGEGQEIYIGEEAGITQWNDAIASKQSDWIVACPEHVASIFSNARQIHADNRLNLNQSLRTHRASDLQKWVNCLLEGQLVDANALFQNLIRDVFPIYITRSIDSARRHAKEKYMGFEDKRYGLLASSKATNLEKHGVQNGFQATRAVKKGPWFSDPPSAMASCCQLNSVATEFACQGLELDFPIVAWGDDLVWDSGSKKWVSKSGRSAAVNPHQLRLNSYRVLLTRGRDGMVIFVPDEPAMNLTAEALKQAGCVDFNAT